MTLMIEGCGCGTLGQPSSATDPSQRRHNQEHKQLHHSETSKSTKVYQGVAEALKTSSTGPNQYC